MKNIKILLTGVMLLTVGIAYAQDTSSKKGNLTITGSVDAYYRFNFNNAKDSARTNNYTSFTNSQNSFELGMASVKADYSIGKADGLVDLGFGRRAEEFSYNDQGTLAAIKQAYVSYAPSGHVKFTMGKWMTHVGYELCDAYQNRNYSLDYMFSYGPFFHTGLKADITVNNNFAFMLGLANPTDMVTASFAKKHFLGQIHVNSTDNKISGYLNYMGGKDLSDATINQFDAVITGTVCSKFSIGYNGSIKMVKPSGGSSASWWGSALYLNYDPTSVFGLTARGEYFGDKKAVAGFGTNIFDLTLSGNIHIDNLTLIPEFRLDGAKDAIFYKNSDTNTPTAKGTGTFILGATYHF
ncbi:MAG: outer membrane beta-barrel protein [Bacteroidota bacterium]|nr:outer membrane beta-barrel protein [Bacteroidota bacterium]